MTYLQSTYALFANILNPTRMWVIIKDQKFTKKQIFIFAIIPIMILIVISNTINKNLLASDTSILHKLSKALTIALFSYLSIIISAFITHFIAKYDSKKERYLQSLQLVLFSSLPGLFISIIIYIFPQLSILGICSFYSFVLFWYGISPILNIDEKNKSGAFTLLIILILSSYSIMGALFIGIQNVLF